MPDSTWKKIDKSNPPERIKEITEGINPTEPLDLYRQRYLGPFEGTKNVRYLNEVLNVMEEGSSLFIFGSGHPGNLNMIYQQSDRISKLYACDLVEEAGINLHPDIEFVVRDIRVCPIIGIDYIFSSHTLEHFVRNAVLEVTKYCIDQAQKGILAVVPYRDIGWGGEPNHRCEFNEDDELAHLFDYYKIIHNGVELCLFKDKISVLFSNNI